MNYMKKLTLLFSSLSIVSSLGAYAVGAPIKVCSEAGYIPFEMKKTTGEWKGYDIELAQKFAQYMHRSIKLVDMKFDGLIPALNGGRDCDIIASAMGVNAEREKAVLFSVPTYKSAFAALIRKKNAEKFKTFDNLNNKETKIASQAGTESDAYVQSDFKTAQKVQFDNNSDPINAIITGRADVYIDDSVYLDIAEARYNDKLLVLPLSILPDNKFGDMAFAFKKDNLALRDAFNSFYKQIEQNGELKKLQAYYFKDMGWMKEFSVQ